MTPLPDKPRVVVFVPRDPEDKIIVASNISVDIDVAVVRNRVTYDQVSLGLPFKEEPFTDVEQTQGSYNRTC